MVSWALLVQFLILLKEVQPGEAGARGRLPRHFRPQKQTNHLLHANTCAETLGRSKESDFSKMTNIKKKKKMSQDKTLQFSGDLANSTLRKGPPSSPASFMAIYPGLCIWLLNGCHDNSVNRIQVTSEGFSGIVLFREKNGSFKPSSTKIS